MSGRTKIILIIIIVNIIIINNDNDNHHHKDTVMDPNMVRLWMDDDGSSPNFAFPRHRWRSYIPVFLAMEIRIIEVQDFIWSDHI